MISKHNNASIIPYSKGGVVVLTSVNLHRNKKKITYFSAKLKTYLLKKHFGNFINETSSQSSKSFRL